jgi:organic radical activating enzyme
VIDLGRNRRYIQGYIDLRNRYTDELNTKPISVESTVDWFDTGKGGAIRVAVEDGQVVAAVIVHKRREVTVFSAKPHMGDNLLTEAEDMAYELGYADLWAKISPENQRSVRLFLRNGYQVDPDGIYRKHLHYGETFGMRPGAETFPLMVITAMTYVCNSRCPACPYTGNPVLRTRHKDAMFMPDDVFHKLSDECGPHHTLLRLCGGGEPFLHPRLGELVRYAKGTGCQVNIITNGSVDVRDLVDVADMIEFSVDAGTAEEHAKIRVGLDWDKVNANVREAMAKRTRTRLICSIVNQAGVDIARAKDHWSFMDAIQVRKFLTFKGDVRNNSADETPFLPPDQRLPCPWLFDRTCINTEGDFTFCGADIRCDYVIGNIHDRSVADIWLGEEYATVRDAHLGRHGDAVEMCSDCPDWKYRSWDYSFWRLRDHASVDTSA